MNKCFRQVVVPAAVILAAVFGSRPSLVTAQRDAPAGEWRVHTGDPGANRYSPLSQITPDNVKDLTVAWRWPAADRALQASNPVLRGSRSQQTPVMANGVLYTVTALGLIAALDPATGQTRWVYDPEGYKAGRPVNAGFVQRGVAYWTDGTVERVYIGTGDAYLVAIDAKTGQPDPTFGAEGKIDLTIGIRNAVRTTNFTARTPPLVAGDVLVMGAAIDDRVTRKEGPPGDVQAFDARTGKKLWAFHTIPHRGEFGYETWLEDSAEYSGAANVWAAMAYDPELDYVYLPTSTPTNDYYGGQRLGDNLFAESLVCLEAKTGKRVWHFQAVHHGLWDYDFATAPILGDITVNGRRIKAVMQVSKQAFTYVFDRKTGKPVWPIVERPVPPTTVPRDRSSPTQPFPTKPPPFDLQGSTEQNLMTFTPELHQRALGVLQKFTHGPLYTPPSLQGTITIPGNFGATGWEGASFDPETAMLYVPSRMMVHFQQIVPGAPTENLLYTQGRPGTPTTPPDGSPGQPGAPAPPPAGSIATPPAPPPNPTLVDDLWLFKPPYSRVTAIDMNRGEHAWMTVVGNGPRNHPLLKDLNLPPLGDGVRGLPLLTKTLLFISTVRLGTNGTPNPPESGYAAKYLEPNAMRKLLYVFNKRTGKLLHEIELDGETAAPPMTYMHQGKQYVVVGVGAGQSAELIALSLPARSNSQN